MSKPYVICHMLQSVDGKVTGDFLYRAECERATDIYYEINRNYKADAFACGRVTMETSFTGGYCPDLSEYEEKATGVDFCIPDICGFYAIAFDRKGKLGWKTPKIEDPDPGYGGAQIIEVLTEQADPRYLGYLQSVGISYIFAGKTEMDLPLALSKLSDLFKIETILLEGGSIINGAFQVQGLIDELSLVCAPVIAGGDSKPLFFDACNEKYCLSTTKIYEDQIIWLNYKKK